ncbi:MAG: hypothetical protein A2252_03125 [Elusimicrobia bacterium RIFOXYA2_FULL_39_19]|nr:MAG: hypothetical protein A2252_03125 [Elusimicrobia bacterium RIFOXYA2_FULL_39_19]
MLKQIIENKKAIILLFILALSLRLTYVFLSPPRPVSYDDTVSWDAVAGNIASGNGFLEANRHPTSTRPPLYPLFLAFIYSVFGYSHLFVKIAHAFLDSITVIVVYLTANILFQKRVAFITGLCLCFYPPLIVYTGIIGSETLFVFLLTTVIYAIIIGVKNENVFLLISAAIILGIANLCRSTLVFYPFFLSAGILLVYNKKYGFYKLARSLILFMLITIVPVIPWTVRNYYAFGNFLLINTSSGALFWSGTYLPWDGKWLDSEAEYFRKISEIDKVKNPVVSDKLLFNLGLKNIKASPIGFLKLSVKKFFRFWLQPVGKELAAKKSVIIGKFISLIHICWLGFALYGFIKSKEQRLLYMPLTVLFIYFMLMHNLISPIARYRLPIEPFIMIFFAYTAKQIIFRGKKHEKLQD